MRIPPTAEHQAPTPVTTRGSTPDTAVTTELTEPAATGLYRDRDGDLWQKTDRGWRLRSQHGVAVDDASYWAWLDGHVRDYAPFVPLGAE
ncbi:hypothetical protein F5X71_17340 [Nocardia brasiliensis]|uniref:Uncharacterized protein n=1 Tax=Nocardia brasiliensis TaxID=37326 RepID=A0A6G9XSG8_NOCBR|nr:hypothetical protein [Nocardia brasiliensis]QIS03855.1 hypothetical protein F5X71_17340 [Nocardia brasiliensis]